MKGTVLAPGPFLGAVAADEPRAALLARDILAQGGSAGDAATALGFALTVTMPSRAGLGGGGVCVARSGKQLAANETGGITIGIGRILAPPPPAPKTEAVVFMPEAIAGAPELGQPTLARGLGALHARFGTLRWEQLVAPAENLARFGSPVSRTLARDIAAAGISVAGPDGKPLQEGALLYQPELAESLGRIRSRGPADILTGGLARDYAEALGLDPSSLRAAAVTMGEPLSVKVGGRTAYFTPGPGGARAAQLFAAAAQDKRSASEDPAQRAAAAAAGGKAGDAAEGEPSATGFVVVDQNGGAVACSLTMGRLFGARRVAGRTGIVASAAPSAGAAAASSAAAMLLAEDGSRELTGGFAAGGDASAPRQLVTVALPAATVEAPTIFTRVLSGRQYSRAGEETRTVQTPTRLGTEAGGGGLVNAVVCGGGLPREPSSCVARHDPGGSGLSTIAEGRAR